MDINYSKSNATGPDEISQEMIKLCILVCTQPIVNIFNSSIRLRKYPEFWKRALIVPIPKNDHPLECKDFRPIALTCFLSKFVEKIVSIQVIEYLEVNNKFDLPQSGYRVEISNQTALLNVIEDAKWAIENRMVTTLLLFDFSKAFDTVPHNRLLLKLKKLGFSMETRD